MTLEETRAKIKALEVELKQAVSDAFTEATKKFFEDHPFVESFGWCQYTPYFNDGDTCYFGVCSDMDAVSVNGVRGNDIEVKAKYELNKEAWYAERELARTDYKDVESLLSIFKENELETLFLDHTQIVVKRDGSTEQDDYYDHD